MATDEKSDDSKSSNKTLDTQEKVENVLDVLRKDLDKDHSLSPEQKNNVVSEMKDNVEKLIKSGVEPTEKMVKVMQVQQVKTEQERTNNHNKSAEISV